MMYFENKINSIDDANDYKRDFISDALNILERALEQEELSNEYFDRHRENEDEVFWRLCCERSERARGLLTAYEIMTTRHVHCYVSAIEDEIDNLKNVFPELR